MATILHIETSTEVCSVAVSQDGLCVFEREDREGPNHAVKSGVFIDEALSHIDSQLLTLDAVAVSATGLADSVRASALPPAATVTLGWPLVRPMRRRGACSAGWAAAAEALSAFGAAGA